MNRPPLSTNSWANDQVNQQAQPQQDLPPKKKKRPATKRPATNKERLSDFEKCASDNNVTRAAYKLEKVSYDKKLTNAEIKAAVNLLIKSQLTTPEKVLKYTTNFSLSKVLCRWPRPSELARMLYVLGHEEAMYYHLRQTVSIPKDVKHGWGTVVGNKGKNLYEVTEQSDILYAWLHRKGSKTAVIHLYGGTRESVIDALDIFKNHEVVSKIINDFDTSKVDVRERFVRKDFTEDFTFDHEAKPFQPATAAEGKANVGGGGGRRPLKKKRAAPATAPKKATH